MDISDKLKIKKKGIRSMRKGTNHTPETKEKLRAANIGRKHTAETKEKIRVANSGKKLSDEHKEKIRVANSGKKLSDEHKEKLTIKSIISGNKAKQVLCITTGEKFSSQHEAARRLFGNDIKSLHISACCKGKMTNVKGYQFKYI